MNPPVFSSGWESRHFYGTDKTERDVFALTLRIPNRNDLSLGYLFLTYLIVIGAGSVMGYLGGKTDMLGLRLVEIWAAAFFIHGHYFGLRDAGLVGSWLARHALLFIAGLVSWTGMTYYIRAAVYEEGRDYVSLLR